MVPFTHAVTRNLSFCNRIRRSPCTTHKGHLGLTPRTLDYIIGSYLGYRTPNLVLGTIVLFHRNDKARNEFLEH